MRTALIQLFKNRKDMEQESSVGSALGIMNCVHGKVPQLLASYANLHPCFYVQSDFSPFRLE